MQGESRAKTFWMVLSLAAFVGAATACFSLFKSDPKPIESACADLEGRARTDCEKRQGR